jgi:hypothetical protein
MNYQFIPEDRLATLMADLFGVSLSRATIGQMSRRVVAHCGHTVADVLSHLAQAG